MTGLDQGASEDCCLELNEEKFLKGQGHVTVNRPAIPKF